MNRRRLSHVIAAGLLAGLLGLPGSALAQPVHRGVPADLWSWFAGFWSRGMVRQSVHVPRALEEKAGLGIDPNGGKPAGSGGTTSTTGLAGSGDPGHGIDPNG